MFLLYFLTYYKYRLLFKIQFKPKIHCLYVIKVISILIESFFFFVFRIQFPMIKFLHEKLINEFIILAKKKSIYGIAKKTFIDFLCDFLLITFQLTYFTYSKVKIVIGKNTVNCLIRKRFSSKNYYY